MSSRRSSQASIAILLAALIVLQSLLSFADMMPLHTADVEHAHHSDGAGPHFHGPDHSGDGHGDGADAEDCHIHHCHGSSVVLESHGIELNFLSCTDQVPLFRKDRNPGYTTLLLRPPIV